MRPSSFSGGGLSGCMDLHQLSDGYSAATCWDPFNLSAERGRLFAKAPPFRVYLGHSRPKVQILGCDNGGGSTFVGPRYLPRCLLSMKHLTTKTDQP